MAYGGGMGKLMGRLVAVCAVVLVAGSAVGCDGRGTDESSATSGIVAPAASTVGQDHAVTFPTLYFEELGEDDPQAFLEERGYADIVANDDGSYSATVPADDYEQLVDDALDLATSIIRGIPDDDTYPDAVAVDYDEQFATVTVSFAADALDAEDALVMHVAGEAATVYQQIAGLPVGCDVILVGSDGSELANTMFPVEESAAAAE